MVLVVSIGAVALLLLSLGGTAVVDTVQTGTIIGAFPFSFVILLMIATLVRRLRCRDKAVRQLEKEVNDPRHRPGDDLVDADGLPLAPEAVAAPGSGAQHTAPAVPAPPTSPTRS
ncbi:BCCT family transporter [Georgenia ruanii]|uniref:BCCT family transporter n=1 Tax=Georgenia ruanii TaxID=348442 RepID=UPI001D0085D8